MSDVYHSLATGNFTQNWTNAGLITLVDDWSGVPSIIGYRGDDITTAQGADPRTLLTEGAPVTGAVVIDVNVNNAAPNTFATGGVTEFAITDPVVALAGSATADAPNLVLFMDATGRQDIIFNFNARDIDGSADNAVQPIAVQYRVGTTGNFINLPAGYLADASTGPSLTGATAVTVTLPPEANNQAQIQIRVMTVNAVGSDEWIGIDDIVVSSVALGTDANAPTLVSSTPVDNASAVAIGNDITLTFNEDVQMVTGGGAIELRLASDNSLVQSFTQANVGTSVTVAGSTLTLNPTADLSNLTNYYVTVANNAVEDLAGNDFAGFSTPATLNFETVSLQTVSVTLNAPTSIVEGQAGTASYSYTVSWSNIAANTALTYSVVGTSANPATVGGAESDINPPLGTLDITAGSGSATITVEATGDGLIERDEQFLLTVAPAAGITINQAGAATILNDDFTKIYDIQGTGHRSPFVAGAIGSIADSGTNRYSVEGVVTAIGSNGFYLQDETGDGNNNSSDGVFVFTNTAPAATITVGERLRVLDARVDEFRSSTANNDLTVTELNASVAGALIQEMNTAATLAPVIIGPAGRSPSQTLFSDPGFAVFDPLAEASDFWESLEGMLVTVDNPIAIAGTSSFSGSDELWVVAQGAFDPTSLNSNGGLTISETDSNPERIQIDDLMTSLAFPDVTAGASLGDITGVVHYSFTNYEILTSTTPTVLTPGILAAPETTTLSALPRQLTIANYNFENLDPSDGIRFSQFASQIVGSLNNPIIIAGQEIQDNSGAANDGVTSSSLTASTMIAAITTAGGSLYSYVDVTPANNTSGGEPNGNIRPGFFYRGDIVEIVGVPTTLDVPAFAGSRDPLIVTFRIIANGVEFTLINNHFSSKGGDNGLQGNVQPPVLNSEVGRTAQAQVVNDYVDSLLLANPNANIVVAGDLNDFTYSLPVQTLIGGAAPVLSELADALIPQATDRYSYIFNGNSQELDHMLTSANALSVATAFYIVHANADFGRLQISDHDPSIALFDARQLAETLNGTAGVDTIQGFAGNDLITGGASDDIIDGGANADTAVYGYSGALPASHGVIWGGQADNFRYRFGSEGTDTLTNVETVSLQQSGGTTTNHATADLTRYFGTEALGINTYGTSVASGGWANNDQFTRSIGDVNGDNRADIVAFGSDFTFVSLGLGDGTFAGQTVGINSFGTSEAGGGWVSDNVYLRKLADVNGDNRADIVGFGSEVTYVSLGQADGTFAATITGIAGFAASVVGGSWGNNNLYTRELADVNGDGRADIVGFGSDSTHVALGQADGTFANSIIGIAGFGASVAGGDWVSREQLPRFVGDISGDGRADIVGFGRTGVSIALGQADGTFGAITLTTNQFSFDSGWFSQDSLPRMLADLNGDGRMDLVGFGFAGTYGALALSDGAGFTDAALMTASFGRGTLDGLWDSNNINPRMLGDVDADNRADLIGFGTTGAITAINSTDFFVI
jgi:Bacterial Ig-like domain/Endonuclease/Exonuclease/phosphatase family/FG-GAP-like repeat/RTX calcium-binding nonapeptide repeat (4 copies)